MDALETLIRETLVERSSDAPPPDSLLAAVEAADRRHPRWPYIVLAAAAVLGIAIGVPLAVGGSSGRPLAERTPGPTVSFDGPQHVTSGPDVKSPHSSVAPVVPGPSSGASSGPPAGPEMPYAEQTVGYHGITIRTPARLGETTFLCKAPRSYLLATDPDVSVHCPMITGDPVRPGLRVTLRPYDPAHRLVPGAGAASTTRVDGHSAVQLLRGNKPQTYFSGTLELADPGVRITVTGPSLAQVKAILATVRVTAQDPLGCPQQPDSTVPANTPSAELVPPGAESVTACSYATYGDGGPFLLESHRLGAGLTARLTTAIDRLHASTAGGAPNMAEGVTWLRFTYPGGSVHTVSVQRYKQPSQITDGNLAATDARARVDSILQSAGR